MNYKGFSDWLAAKLGTRQWCVASRLTERMKAKGYEVALSPSRYRELEAEFQAERANA